jgi:hypothetical protein
MILADTVTTLTTMTPRSLAKTLDTSGYKDCKFDTARFLGLTNGAQFCYSVTFVEDGREQTGKVFVTYDSATGFLVADF